MFNLFSGSGDNKLLDRLVSELHSINGDSTQWRQCKLASVSYYCASSNASSLSLTLAASPWLAQSPGLHPLKITRAEQPNATFTSQTGPSEPSVAVSGRVSEELAFTLISQDGLSLGHLVDVLSALSAREGSVISIKTLSNPADTVVTAIDVIAQLKHESVDEALDPLALWRPIMYNLGLSYPIDITVQRHNVFRRHKRLVIFDMDSTLIQQEVIDEIARRAGVVEQVSKITESAMRGEIDFKESLQRRVALLKGCPVSVLDDVRASITFSDGARDLCRALKRLGCKLAVISGGFMPLARFVQAELQLDYAFANNLEVEKDGNCFQGTTSGPIVDATRKAELLTVISQAESVYEIQQTTAIGDGANDLQMLAAAGFGIAYNAKPKVQQHADARINQPSLTNVLYLMGLEWSEICLLIE
ncbi:hypothetical protein BASA50_001377 [Batrachochytrium salamandrivorans]|uniref:phosphoserine phosphatase n=1 Tax=Batrachochytrium salamandrivorans TaxID=1357716 RepID=A0ABQ8EVE9_9FUNG|nr:hypothetical protein BASA50_001377 [Batrachochytrium salamandrivorans]